MSQQEIQKWIDEMVAKGYRVLGHFEREHRWRTWRWTARLEAFGKKGVAETFGSWDIRSAIQCKNVFFDEKTTSQVIEEML